MNSLILETILRKLLTFCLAASTTSCIYFALLGILILVSLKDLETKLCKYNQKEVASVQYNLRRGFTLSITFKAIDSPERSTPKLHPRYFTYACCLISIPYNN